MPVAVTIIAKRRHLKGQHYFGYFAFTGSYTAAGESVTAASMGLTKLDGVFLNNIVQGATHAYFPSVVPTSPDSNGRFTAFTLPILDMTYSAIAAADLAASSYPAALTGLAPGMYFSAVGF